MTGEALARVLNPIMVSSDPQTNVVLVAVLEAYREDTGEQVSSNLTDAERDRVGSWLREICRDPSAAPGASLMFMPRRLAHLPLYESTAAKHNWLNQQSCPSCPAGSGSIITFPVEVPPWSHQTSRKIGPALREAMRANPTYADAHLVLEEPVCMRIVFVLPPDATMKDCDNMAKGFVDAFQGLLYKDDRQIEHLDLLRLRDLSGSRGHILVRLATTQLNDRDDVLLKRDATIAWMDAQSLRLDDFLHPR